jgi:signal peptidase I
VEAVTEPVSQIEVAPQPSTEPQRTSHKPGLSGLVQWLLSVIVIATFVITFAVQAFIIPSSSMEDTLLVGDYLLVDKVKYANGGVWRLLEPYRQIHRGDIIVFHYPVRPSQHFVKRVIGTPGDRVRIVNKQVLLNGKALSEPYTVHKRGDRNYFRDDFPTTRYFEGNVDTKWWLQMKKLTEDGELIVPEDHYFVLGDNRDDSFDSRYWGFVPAENVVGRPLLIYWSIEQPEDNEEISGWNAKLNRVANGVRRLFRDTRWKRMMTVVH